MLPLQMLSSKSEMSFCDPLVSTGFMKVRVWSDQNKIRICPNSCVVNAWFIIFVIALKVVAPLMIRRVIGFALININ